MSPVLAYMSVSTFFGKKTIKKKKKTYHDGITGSSGQVNVVRVGGDSTISLLYVACHILTDALDALAGTVGPFEHMKMNFDSVQCTDRPNKLLMSRQMEVDARDDWHVVGGAKGELSDLYCGLRRPREYVVPFSWRPLETWCLPVVQGKNIEPGPERSGHRNHISH